MYRIILPNSPDEPGNPTNDVNRDDDPENPHVAGFFPFMPEIVLAQDRARPPADQFQQMKRFLTGSRGAPPGGALVPAVGKECHKAGQKIEAQDVEVHACDFTQLQVSASALQSKHQQRCRQLWIDRQRILRRFLRRRIMHRGLGRFCRIFQFSVIAGSRC